MDRKTVPPPQMFITASLSGIANVSSPSITKGPVTSLKSRRGGDGNGEGLSSFPSLLGTGKLRVPDRNSMDEICGEGFPFCSKAVQARHLHAFYDLELRTYDLGKYPLRSILRVHLAIHGSVDLEFNVQIFSAQCIEFLEKHVLKILTKPDTVPACAAVQSRCGNSLG